MVNVIACVTLAAAIYLSAVVRRLRSEASLARDEIASLRMRITHYEIVHDLPADCCEVLRWPDDTP